jgi:hypothetical protein
MVFRDNNLTLNAGFKKVHINHGVGGLPVRGPTGGAASMLISAHTSTLPPLRKSNSSIKPEPSQNIRPSSRSSSSAIYQESSSSGRPSSRPSSSSIGQRLQRNDFRDESGRPGTASQNSTIDTEFLGMFGNNVDHI